jgi:ubiquinone/menaquinone biosynthesis C-methylase UbiE
VDAQPHREEAALEVGCGPGSVARWLVGHVSLDSPLTTVDVNSCLLREGAALAKAEGLDGRIEFQEVDAEALPFASESFDVTLSFTVMEEVDADRMLAEMLRVTRRGGRVGVVVRATDQPRFLNISLPPELDAKELACRPRALVLQAVDARTSACTGDSWMRVWWTSRWDRNWHWILWRDPPVETFLSTSTL